MEPSYRKHGALKGRDGQRHRFLITDEIRRPQSGQPKKLLCLQRIKFDDGRVELRLAYYIVGKKGRMRGRWVWGQYATMLPAKDFRMLVRLAKAKGWI